MSVINPKVKDGQLAKVLKRIANGTHSPKGLFVKTSERGWVEVASVKEVDTNVYQLIPKIG